MLIQKEFIYVFGYDRTIVKYNYAKKEKDVIIKAKKSASAVKIVTCNADSGMPVKIAVSFTDSEVVLYDLNLNVLFSVYRQTSIEVIKMVQLSPIELLLFHREG